MESAAVENMAGSALEQEVMRLAIVELSTAG
jgi:hypothetical protein